ncbi:uncharacterized protein HMPREF1541_06338 [Cyphellophora europaea CBS 101466]|uniref:Uncharacterized protein n=1 Tax=Cyphellophora europaea (strain CBS 101466) TaxID=1220924 RepID=W2RPA7_CYPE1|nr:uncharacterized protein HMPREF1541_06338 [Cyphellophora europaea CBS 101466]ETN38307.1 hypothetical protein HMPREF1541_06338 [Cyphellophora europaea CBS 101466]
MHPFSPTSPALASTCGPTVATAQHNNCTYEPMLRSWIPPLCYHPAPTQDYTPFDDRPWYYDHNLTQPITSATDLDALRTGANLTAYTNTFHDEHCLYAWRKLALAVQHRWRWLDTKTMSLAHSEHCAKRIARFVFSVGYAVGEERFGHTSTAPIMVQGCVELPWGREGRWWKFG